MLSHYLYEKNVLFLIDEQQTEVAVRSFSVLVIVYGYTLRFSCSLPSSSANDEGRVLFSMVSTYHKVVFPAQKKYSEIETRNSYTCVRVRIDSRQTQSLVVTIVCVFVEVFPSGCCHCNHMVSVSSDHIIGGAAYHQMTHICVEAKCGYDHAKWRRARMSYNQSDLYYQFNAELEHIDIPLFFTRWLWRIYG